MEKHIITEDEILNIIDGNIIITNLASSIGINSHKCLDLVSYPIFKQSKLRLFQDKKEIKSFDFTPTGVKKAVAAYNELP